MFGNGSDSNTIERMEMVEDSSRSNEMEGRSESDRRGDEVYSATLGDEEKTNLKLD